MDAADDSVVSLRPDRWAKAIQDAMPALIPLGIIGADSYKSVEHGAHDTSERTMRRNVAMHPLYWCSQCASIWNAASGALCEMVQTVQVGDKAKCITGGV